MIDEADDWMRAQIDAQRPFLLVYASPVPHLALQVPPERLQQFDGMGRDGDDVHRRTAGAGRLVSLGVEH